MVFNDNINMSDTNQLCKLLAESDNALITTEFQIDDQL